MLEDYCSRSGHALRSSRPDAGRFAIMQRFINPRAKRDLVGRTCLSNAAIARLAETHRGMSEANGMKKVRSHATI